MEAVGFGFAFLGAQGTDEVCCSLFVLLGLVVASVRFPGRMVGWLVCWWHPFLLKPSRPFDQFNAIGFGATGLDVWRREARLTYHGIRGLRKTRCRCTSLVKCVRCE